MPARPLPWFRPAALTFLRGLKRNNRREWFEAHRETYVREVLDPLRRVATELDVRFARLAPEFEAGRRSLFRIHRDVRFSRDKSPYKTHAALWVYHRAPGRGVGKEIDGGAGFYLHLEPGASIVAAGLWMPPRHSLNKVRDRLAGDHRRFRRIVTAPAFVKRFGGLTDDEPGVKLKRMPRGFAETHPAADWLRFNSFTVSTGYSDAEMLAPGLIDRAMKDYALMLPLVRWLNEALGYPSATAR
ncbi:MAG TPA: DUF2461 domain-containing protein [Gemmatimonadaceae bacterium]|nr:DUF2461 domain-containing protein [Opitutus sp.]HVZ48302.1 DUF2461 domain-containing protein [Gemmatimonadaceae bacterium]